MSAATRNARQNPPAEPDRRRREALDDDATADLFTTLARTGLFLDALQSECLGEHDLAFTEYSVLRLLQRAPGEQLAPSHLAGQVVCTTGAMTKVVDRLERAGLVKRMPDPADRRRILVRLTRAGDRHANAAAETYRAGRERVLARLAEREAHGIAGALGRLLDALENDRREIDSCADEV